MISVVGLDLSSSSTGVCDNGKCFTVAPAKRQPMFDRCVTIVDDLADTLESADMIVLEAIGTRHVQTAIAIATVHALVLSAINSMADVSAIAVPPAALKKYATGRGNAPKDAVLIAALKAGAHVDNNDEADAWWLYAIGRHLIGEHVAPVTAYRAAVAGDIATRKAAA